MGHHTSPSLLDVEELSIDSPQRTLLHGAGFSLQPGRHVALAGRNGGGKTSLLDLIETSWRGEPPPGHLTVHGAIRRRAGATLGYLRQNPRASELTGSVRAFLDTYAGEAARVHALYQTLVGRLADDPENASALRELGAASEHLTVIGGWDVEERRNAVLTALHLDTDGLKRALHTVSGGEATRIALAGLLLAEPDVVLLDEPTNNLDRPGMEYLADWMSTTRAAVLLVSHDRAFLDATVDEMLVIDEETATLRTYGGNYSFFREQRDAEFAARVRRFEEGQARRAQLLATAGVISARGRRFDALSQNDYYRGRGKKVARQSVVMRARIERELARIDVPAPPVRPRFEVPSPSPREGVLLAARDLDIGYSAGAPVAREINLTVHAGERVVVAGPNGSGKTTLLRTLAGQVPPLGGTLTRAVGPAAVMLRQSVATAADVGAVDHARGQVSLSEDDVRRVLGKVVFGDVGSLPLSAFSAGERRRMELAMVFVARPELLILDEPTNHLDLLTIEMLEEALAAFTGALIVVSHDLGFLDAVAAPHANRYLLESRRLARTYDEPHPRYRGMGRRC